MASQGSQVGRATTGAVLLGAALALAVLSSCDRAAEPPAPAEPAPISSETVDLPASSQTAGAPPPPQLPAQEIATAPPEAPTPPAAAARPIDPAYVLSCNGPFGTRTTLADLRARFGAANVVEEAILGPEASEWDGVVVFPDDPARRIEIVWADVAAKRGVASALVYDEASVWSGPGGLRIGADLTAVETANDGEFVLYGFEWDYGGVVSDWLGGRLFEETPQQVCNLQVRFGVIDTIDPDLAISVAGDAPFSSSDERMRAAGPVVRQLGIGFADAG